MDPVIAGLFRSDGGVPKRPVEVAEVTAGGMIGDRQDDLIHHGGPDRALCLYSRERLDALRAEGHPIHPGMIGENVLLSGVEWHALAPGMWLNLGEAVEIEITDYADPCKTIGPAFTDRRFVRISQKVNLGWSRLVARVHKAGVVRVGDRVVVHAPSGPPSDVRR